MFKNRALQVKMVKTDAAVVDHEENVVPAYQDPELMNQIAKDFVRSTAIVIVASLAAAVVLNTLSQIAVKAAESKLK